MTMSKQLNETELVVVDLETTALDWTKGHILEVGAVIADAKTLEVKASRSWVIRPLGAWPELMSLEALKAEANDFVRQMHEKNGLWEEVGASTDTLLHVSQQFPEWLKSNGLDYNQQQFTMAGNGLDRFDRPWLRYNAVELHNLDDLFHYRSLDISNLLYALKMAGRGDVMEGLTHEPSNHRAVDDCLMSLKTWAHIRSVIGRPE
jgi:oligoribonuclease